ARPDRIAVGGRSHIAPRQRQTRLQTQRIAATQTAGLRPAFHEEPPHSHRLLDREEELEAILARVTGARDTTGHPIEPPHGSPVELERLQVDVDELLHE